MFHLSSRSTSKFLSPATCPTTPSNDLNNGDLYVFPTPSEPSTDNTDLDDLQSSSKDGKTKNKIFLKN
jgi:hypothetical protein